MLFSLIASGIIAACVDGDGTSVVHINFNIQTAAKGKNHGVAYHV